MKVSVALCTYNGEKYLEEQLESIFNQTAMVDEVVIVDDISTDDTIDILKKNKQKWPDKLFFEVNEVNVGVIKNFQKAIFKCSGDVIFLCDQDDIWYNYKVEKVLNKFNESKNVEAIFSDGLLVDEHGDSLKNTLFKYISFNSENQSLWKKGNAVVEITKGLNKITGATLAIKRELFTRSSPFYSNLLLHDSWLGLNAAALERLDWVTEPLIKYRVHKDQQVGLGHWNSTNLKPISRRETIIEYSKQQETWLILIEYIVKKYNKIENDTMVNFRKHYKEQKALVYLLKFRANLPSNFFLRLLMILKRINKYYKVFSSPIPVRTIMSDIFTKH